ncbi:MAG: peptide-methionine (S)-S-oxide reductase, partial [Proteobacteria bacterium]|nr:peptide-methionine (S)-S-oxide reductase [Pseudomonadota bacterium]
MSGFNKTTIMPSAEQALPGRNQAIAVPEKHFVNGNSMSPPYPDGYES